MHRAQDRLAAKAETGLAFARQPPSWPPWPRPDQAAAARDETTQNDNASNSLQSSWSLVLHLQSCAQVVLCRRLAGPPLPASQCPSLHLSFASSLSSRQLRPNERQLVETSCRLQWTSRAFYQEQLKTCRCNATPRLRRGKMTHCMHS